MPSLEAKASFCILKFRNASTSSASGKKITECIEVTPPKKVTELVEVAVTEPVEVPFIPTSST
jgi:methyl coenzyme M reductase gamma subunit